jgi:hypothetical protein
MPRINDVEYIKTKQILDDEELLDILRDFIDVCDQKGENPTKARFTKYTRLNFDYSKINSISRRFSSLNNSSDGWSNALIKCGRIPKRSWKDLQEILDIYYKAYIELGEKQPTCEEMKKFGIAPNSMQYVFRRLLPGLTSGGHLRAIELMYKQHGIKKTVKIPEFDTKRRRKKGEDLRDFKIDVNNFGLELGPVNEQGVVALFSKIHSFIGFPRLTYVTQYFPDCEAECTLSSRSRNREQVDYVSIEFKHNTAKLSATKKENENWHTIHYLVCWETNENDVFRKKIEKEGVRVISLKEKLSDATIVDRINDAYRLFNQRAVESGK